jgi:uncharacterized OB-fold protein
LTETAPPPPRKLPELEPETTFFWTSGADGVLRILRCTDCGHWQHPPLPRCRACSSEAVAPQPVSGRGKVATYTINYEQWIPGLQVPFVFAAVELEEQPELYVFTNILAPVDQVKRGMPVTVSFEQHEDVWLPMFSPAEGEQ